MLTQDEVEKSLRHLCVVKNNYLADKAKSESYILKFNDHLAFENTVDRIELDKIVYQDWIEDAMDMREKGLSYRMISERLKEDGYNVSKSVLQRKLS